MVSSSLGTIATRKKVCLCPASWDNFTHKNKTLQKLSYTSADRFYQNILQRIKWPTTQRRALLNHGCSWEIARHGLLERYQAWRTVNNVSVLWGNVSFSNSLVANRTKQKKARDIVALSFFCVEPPVPYMLHKICARAQVEGNRKRNSHLHIPVINFLASRWCNWKKWEKHV